MLIRICGNSWIGFGKLFLVSMYSYCSSYITQAHIKVVTFITCAKYYHSPFGYPSSDKSYLWLEHWEIESEKNVLYFFSL